jgi:hypothetical protein
MSLGEFDLYQAVAVHDCYIVVGICLFGLKVYRLLSSPNGDLLQETGNNRKYEIKVRNNYLIVSSTQRGLFMGISS